MKSTRRIGILQSDVVLHSEQTLLAFRSNNGKFGHRVLSLVFHSVGSLRVVFAFIPVVIILRNIQAYLAHRPLRVTQISVIDTRASTPLSKAPISKTRPYTGQAWGGNFFCHREILNDPRAYRTIWISFRFVMEINTHFPCKYSSRCNAKFFHGSKY